MLCQIFKCPCICAIRQRVVLNGIVFLTFLVVHENCIVNILKSFLFNMGLIFYLIHIYICSFSVCTCSYSGSIMFKSNYGIHGILLREWRFFFYNLITGQLGKVNVFIGWYPTTKELNGTLHGARSCGLGLHCKCWRGWRSCLRVHLQLSIPRSIETWRPQGWIVRWNILKFLENVPAWIQVLISPFCPWWNVNRGWGLGLGWQAHKKVSAVVDTSPCVGDPHTDRNHSPILLLHILSLSITIFGYYF